MSTRLKRPSFWRRILVTGILVALQAYLGYSVVSGQFGIESQRQMKIDIERLEAKSAALQAEIDAYRHRTALFDPERLDPDIVSERARALLAMAKPDEMIVMVNETTGEPLFSSFPQLAVGELTDIIEAQTGE